MKKLFFFRSSSSNNGSAAAPPLAEKQVCWDVPVESELSNRSGEKVDTNHRSAKGLFSKSRKQVCDSPNSGTSSGLIRSRSLSSAAFLGDFLDRQNLSCNGSPSSGTCVQHHNGDFSSRGRDFAPERQVSRKLFERTVNQQIHGCERPGSSASSSSNFSGKVLDRYIDGEQQQERSRPRISSLQRNLGENGSSSGRLPPRQHTAPTSPKDSAEDKPRSHSFREAKGTRLHFNSRDLVENGFDHEYPRRMAKNVIERLSQTHVFPKSSKEFDHDIPITLEDIYGGPSKCFNSNVDVPSRRSYSLDDPCKTSSHYHGEDSFFHKQECLLGNSFQDVTSVQMEEENIDLELQQKSKLSEERVILLSKELEQESFLDDSGFDVPSLIQTIRSLMEDKIGLAMEVLSLLKSRIAERKSANEELRLAKSELESCTQRLEKEKNELQSALEKEIDRRSTDWSMKLQKYQLEEQRLRERVRELAEQNVSLQREVSSLTEKETESKNIISYSEQQIRQLTSRVNEESKETHNLRQSLCELEEKYAEAVRNLDSVSRNFQEKDSECKDLQKSITRLSRTCSEQEKTIEGLREEFNRNFEEQQSLDKFNKHIGKLQMEQLRLTGVELALRKEVESQRLETDCLRQENIMLLNRLKSNGKEVDALTFKLDKEMWTRTFCLQSQGLSLLNESTHLCLKLLEYIKAKEARLSENNENLQINKNGLDGQFLIESDVKVKGFKRGTESLTRSLQTISSLLQEKSSPVASESHTPCKTDSGSGKSNQILEDNLRFELKAETLLTNLLKEKLYSKELEVEQLQAELSAAVRGNDVLRCEVQNVLDGFSCANHKLKDSELKILKKDENIIRLQNELEGSMKELTIIKGILPKVSEERDLMWEEVKKYNEKNMLLDSEINVLKKKIDALEEDILLKEGQITILKDTLGSRPFNLLDSSDLTNEFLIK